MLFSSYPHCIRRGAGIVKLNESKCISHSNIPCIIVQIKFCQFYTWSSWRDSCALLCRCGLILIYWTILKGSSWWWSLLWGVTLLCNAQRQQKNLFSASNVSIKVVNFQISKSTGISRVLKSCCINMVQWFSTSQAPINIRNRSLPTTWLYSE